MGIEAILQITGIALPAVLKLVENLKRQGATVDLKLVEDGIVRTSDETIAMIDQWRRENPKVS